MFGSKPPSSSLGRLFWYADQVSDQVDIDYPSGCRSTQVIFIQSSPTIAENVSVFAGVPISVEVSSKR